MKTTKALYNVLLDYCEAQENNPLCQSCPDKIKQIAQINPELLRIKPTADFAFQVTYQSGNSDIVVIFSNKEKEKY